MKEIGLALLIVFLILAISYAIAWLVPVTRNLAVILMLIGFVTLFVGVFLIFRTYID